MDQGMKHAMTKYRMTALKRAFCYAFDQGNALYWGISVFSPQKSAHGRAKAWKRRANGNGRDHAQQG